MSRSDGDVRLFRGIDDAPPEVLEPMEQARHEFIGWSSGFGTLAILFHTLRSITRRTGLKRTANLDEFSQILEYSRLSCSRRVRSFGAQKRREWFIDPSQSAPRIKPLGQMRHDSLCILGEWAVGRLDLVPYTQFGITTKAIPSFVFLAPKFLETMSQQTQFLVELRERG
jgi:hypothetical protein